MSTATEIFPFSRMTFYQAMFWLKQGYKVRRAIWRLCPALPFQVAGPSDVDYRWFYAVPEKEVPGVYVFDNADAQRAIITNVLLTAEDMMALDWTCDAIDPGVDSYDPGTTNPNGGKAGVTIVTDDDGATDGGGGAGSGAGGAGGGAGSMGSGSGGSKDAGFSGIGGGGGSGGGGGGKTKKKTPPAFNPTVFFDAWSLAGPPWEYGISGSGSSAAIQQTTPATEAFGGNIYVSSAPGDLFFLTITHGSPTGSQIVYHGTIGSGQSKDFTFNITALPRETQWPYTDEVADPFYRVDGYTTIPGSGAFAVTAVLYIPNRPGTTITRSVNVHMRGHGQQCPGGIYSRTSMVCGTQA